MRLKDQTSLYESIGARGFVGGSIVPQAPPAALLGSAPARASIQRGIRSLKPGGRSTAPTVSLIAMT